MLNTVRNELRDHAPYTLTGALTGIFIMAASREMSLHVAYNIFYVLHPIHVVLSALVTASMFALHTCGRVRGKCLRGRCNFWKLAVVGYAGSVGVATLSDSLIPYVGETLLAMPNRGIHIGFIEEWWLVNPLALLGVIFAYFRPSTKFPHAGHVLLSTWASLFHMLMAGTRDIGGFGFVLIFFFLFLAVWLPCCISDIVFPLLFAHQKS